MKKSKFALMGSGIAMAILAFTGLQSFTPKATHTYFFQTPTGLQSTIRTDEFCESNKVQCTIITTSGAHYELWKNQQLTIPALHAAS